GELEAMMLYSFIRTSKLQRWLSRNDSPPAIQECKFLFDSTYAPKSAATLDEELAEDPLDDSIQAPSSTVAVPVSEDLFALVKQRTAILRARLKFNGTVYSRASTHIGNSQIFFYPHGDCLSSPVPGSIQHIYATPMGELVFAVHKLLPCRDQTIDPFAIYSHFPAKMYSSSSSTHLEMVKVSWVVSHFAQWAISSHTAVILSLSHV
ncbi:hypothetical protein CY34DRAFT_58202, partial [Suillus luteus UH-Slu-Lm8-n1]